VSGARFFTVPVAVAALMFTGAVHAGSSFKCGGCATESTQWANNALLFKKVNEETKTLRKLYETYVVEVQRLEQQIMAGMKLPGLAVADVLKVKRDFEQYQTALRSLGHDLGSISSVLDTRLTEASIMNISLPDYLRREGERIAKGNQAAKARVQREVAMVSAVQADIQQVSAWGQQISSTYGVHSSQQLFNSQLNMMATQLTRLVQMTAEAQGSDAAQKANDKAVQRAGVNRVLEDIAKGQQAVRERNDGIIQRMEQGATAR